MLVWSGRRTVVGKGQYTLLSGRPVQTGQVLFEFKITMAQSALGIFVNNDILSVNFIYYKLVLIQAGKTRQLLNRKTTFKQNLSIFDFVTKQIVLLK